MQLPLAKARGRGAELCARAGGRTSIDFSAENGETIGTAKRHGLCRNRKDERRVAIRPPLWPNVERRKWRDEGGGESPPHPDARRHYVA